MEAILKSGKKIKGKLAQILVRRGRATPLEFIPEEIKPKAVKKPKAPKKSKDIFDSEEMFEMDTNIVFERYSGAVVRYEYGELFTVRVQDNFTDTFAIAMRSLKMDTIANKHKRLFLKRLKFQFDVNGKLLDMNFFKRIYPNQLLKAEP